MKFLILKYFRELNSYLKRFGMNESMMIILFENKPHIERLTFHGKVYR